MAHACCMQEEQVPVSLQNDECVFRDDTVVLLEMTTRDLMEVCILASDQSDQFLTFAWQKCAHGHTLEGVYAQEPCSRADVQSPSPLKV